MKNILFLLLFPLSLFSQKRIQEPPSSLVQKLVDSITISADFQTYWTENKKLLALVGIGYFKIPFIEMSSSDTAKRNQAQRIIQEMTLATKSFKADKTLTEAQLKEKKVQLWTEKGFSHAAQCVDFQEKVKSLEQKVINHYTPQYATLEDVTKAFFMVVGKINATESFAKSPIGKENEKNFPAYKLPIPLPFTPEKEADGIYIIAEKMPEYPECPSAKKMYEAIHRNLRFPADWWKGRVMGNVNVHFIVNENGVISDIKATEHRIRDAKSATKQLEGFEKDAPLFFAEAERVVALLPQKWLPAMQGGQAVKIRYLLPVFFSSAMK